MCVYLLQIQEAGFDILMNEERTMTEAEMRLFYQLRAGEVSFSVFIYPICLHFFIFLQLYVYRLILVWEKLDYYEEQDYEQQVGHEITLSIMITGCVRETLVMLPKIRV